MGDDQSGRPDRGGSGVLVVDAMRGERRGQQRLGRGEDELELVEGQQSFERDRVVLAKEVERLVRRQEAGREVDRSHHRLLEVLAVGQLRAQQADQVQDLGRDRRPHDGGLAAGEQPVHRGAGDAGLTRHVVHGRLGESPSAQADQQRLGDALLGAGDRRSAQHRVGEVDQRSTRRCRVGGDMSGVRACAAGDGGHRCEQ